MIESILPILTISFVKTRKFMIIWKSDVTKFANIFWQSVLKSNDCKG